MEFSSVHWFPWYSLNLFENSLSRTKKQGDWLVGHRDILHKDGEGPV